jgi:hypothetical protein
VKKKIRKRMATQQQQQMSVTQGLSELKLLEKRIATALRNIEWATVRTKTRAVDVDAFTRQARAEYQSYNDLLARRLRIKCAIVTSNATTRVKVGIWEGSVAEAIEYKTSISYKKTLLADMKRILLLKREEFDKEQESINRRLDVLLQSELGKDVRTNPDTIQTLTTTFRESNKVELIDPLNLAEKIKVLELEIDEFDANVDWVLSESNGRTMILV